MSYTKESVIRRLENIDGVKEVGDLGNSVVAYDAHPNRKMKTFGGFISETGWVPVATDMDERGIFLRPN